MYWADPADRVAAFLSSAPGGLGSTPTLTQTWQDIRGIYVFLGAPAADSDAFREALQTWMEYYAPQRVRRFLWIADPAAPPTAWTTSSLTGRTGPGGTWLSRGTTFPLAEYRLAVVGGGPVAPAETAAGWGFSVAGGGRPAVTLYSPTDPFPAPPGPALLSMEAGHTGTWRFLISAPAGSGDAFTRLGAGIRFFTPRDDGYVDGVHFAALGQPGGSDLLLHAQIDPLRPLDGDRTSLGFFSSAGEGDPPALPSGYATVLGGGVTLRPLAPEDSPAARLVFGTAPYFAGAPANPGYYLTPAGSFTVDAGPDGRPPEQLVLCAPRLCPDTATMHGPLLTYELESVTEAPPGTHTPFGRVHHYRHTARK